MARTYAGVLVGLVVGTGCAAGSADIHSRDDAWRAEFEGLKGNLSTNAQLRRSDLAYDAIALHPDRLQRLGLQTADVARAGLDSLYRAAEAHPERMQTWGMLEGWRHLLGSRFDGATASRAACAAADKTREAALERLCGDLLQQAGDVPQAVARWKMAASLGRPRLETEAAAERIDCPTADRTQLLALERACGDRLAQAGRASEAIARWKAALGEARSPADRYGLVLRIAQMDVAAVSPADLQAAFAWQRAQQAGDACRGQCQFQLMTCIQAYSAAANSSGFASPPSIESCSAGLEACNAGCGPGAE